MDLPGNTAELLGKAILRKLTGPAALIAFALACLVVGLYLAATAVPASA